MTEKRMLGCWEAKCKLGHDLLKGTSLMFACVCFKGTLKPSILIKSFACLFDRHPLLRAIIREGLDGGFFELSANLSNIPIVFEELPSHGTWQKSVEDVMQCMLDTTQYLWRAKILSNGDEHYLILSIHHAITDGLSLGNLLHELFLTYDNIIEDDSFAWPKLDFNENVEKLLVETNSWDCYLKHQAQANEWQIEPMPYHNFARISERKSKNIYSRINQEQLESIKATCKTQKVTINDLLNATMLYTAAQMQDSTLSTTLITPITLRQYCKPRLNQKHLGCNIAMIRTLHEDISTKTNIWQLARSYHDQLIMRIPHLGFLPREFNFRELDIENMASLFGMKGATKRKHFLDPYGLTNLLHLKLKPSYQQFEINDVNICSNHVAGDFGVLVGVTALNNRLSIVFMYTEPLLDKSWVENYATNYKLNLLRFCSLQPNLRL